MFCVSSIRRGTIDVPENHVKFYSLFSILSFRFGYDGGTVKPIRSTRQPLKVVRPVKIQDSSIEDRRENVATQKIPKIQTSAELSTSPLSVSGINSKNFAFLNRNTKTHSQFQGRTKFGNVDENGRALQVPIDGLPRVGFGTKNEDDTVLNAKLSLPKNWLSGQDLAAEGLLSRKLNNGLFGGAQFPNDQQQFVIRRN